MNRYEVTWEGKIYLSRIIEADSRKEALARIYNEPLTLQYVTEYKKIDESIEIKERKRNEDL